MVKIVSQTRDAVTVTITLPIGGFFDQHVEAVGRAKREAMKLQHGAAVEALHVLGLLLERGRLAFEYEVDPRQFLSAPAEIPPPPKS